MRRPARRGTSGDKAFHAAARREASEAERKLLESVRQAVRTEDHKAINVVPKRGQLKQSTFNRQHDNGQGYLFPIVEGSRVLPCGFCLVSAVNMSRSYLKQRRFVANLYRQGKDRTFDQTSADRLISVEAMDDIGQEVARKLLTYGNNPERLGRSLAKVIDADKPLRSWLWSIVCNTARAYYDRRDNAFSFAVDMSGRVVADSMDVETLHNVLHGQEVYSVARAISQDHGRICRLLAMGYSLTETAEKLALTRQQVNRRLADIRLLASKVSSLRRAT